jgi:hypothetical protein
LACKKVKFEDAGHPLRAALAAFVRHFYGSALGYFGFMIND